jgi:hypothetical protein
MSHIRPNDKYVAKTEKCQGMFPGQSHLIFWDFLAGKGQFLPSVIGSSKAATHVMKVISTSSMYRLRTGDFSPEGASM